MHQARLLYAPGAPHRAHIAGQAIPHGVAGQDLFLHTGTRHSDEFRRRVLHLIGIGAGSSAGAALDTYLDAFAAGNRAYLINECTGFCFRYHITSPLPFRTLNLLYTI